MSTRTSSRLLTSLRFLHQPKAINESTSPERSGKDVALDDIVRSPSTTVPSIKETVIAGVRETPTTRCCRKVGKRQMALKAWGS